MRTNGSWHSVPGHDNTQRAGESRGQIVRGCSATGARGVLACSAKCHQLLCHCFGPAPWPIKCIRLLCKTKTIKNDDKKQRQPSPLRTRLSSRSASPSSHSALALSMPLAEAPLAASTCAQRSRTHTQGESGKTVDSAAIFIVTTVEVAARGWRHWLLHSLPHSPPQKRAHC